MTGHPRESRMLLLVILAAAALVGYTSLHEATVLFNHVSAALDAYLQGGAA